MKILFICSSLEPGKDGVGDYARRMASELTKNGIITAAVALNDQHVSDDVLLEHQSLENGVLPTLRLPSTLKVSERIKHAKNYIDDFNPDWLSLQFVIFGHHPKGLPFGIDKQLAYIGGRDRKWHIMFHELWIGMAIESSKKEKYWGLVQKYIIRKLISGLQPRLITTQSSLYKAQLTKLNVESEYLPLFGNIPLADRVEQKQSSQKDLNFVVFGTIHPGSPIRQFVEEAATYKQKNNIDITLKIIGKSGDELKNWVSTWKAVGLPVEIMGEQPADVVSSTLSNASMGISSSAFNMIEKSGTVAAMREHGLNVICVGNPYHPRGIENISSPEGVFEYKADNFEACISHNLKSPSTVNTTYVAKLFTKLLAKSKYPIK